MQPRKKDPNPEQEKLLRELEELLAIRLGTPYTDPELEEKIQKAIKTLQRARGEH